MKLRGWFLLLTGLLALMWALLTFQAFLPSHQLFYALEGLSLLTLLFLFFFYRRVIRPIQTIANGMELLKEQDFSSRLRSVGQREADRIVVIFNRMMQQLKDERLRLREQNHFLDLLIEASSMGVILLDFDGKITSLNPAAKRFLATGTLAQQLSTLAANEVKTFQLNDSHIYRCSRLSFVDRGFAHPFILIESLTDEVMKAEKKAYEKVIRMIAHEVNNTTAGVTSTLDTVSDALTDLPDTDDLREVMRVCIERCFSMSGFITRFADVVKIPEPQMQQADLNDRVQACLSFMEQLCANRHIRLTFQRASRPVLVQMDTDLFEQALVNIIKNAVESIDKEGEIVVSTTGEPATVVVADSGAGISAEASQKLFSPFFSTKPNGQGIGLLFIREVLTRHQCRFSLQTDADGWTRFRICFHPS